MAPALPTLAATYTLLLILGRCSVGYVVSLEGEPAEHGPDVRRAYPFNEQPLSNGFSRMGYKHQYQPYFLSEYTGQSANVSRVLDTLLHGYDKRLRPKYKGPPVEIGVTMFVSSVSSISEVDMDFTVDFYFRQHWHDPRLAFSEEVEDELCISNEMLAQIWWPDTFFANAKDARFHIATTKNAFLRIKPNGDVLHSLRLTVTAMCRMDLTYFPMDSQICSLEIESYGYSIKDIKYTWKDGPGKSVDIDKNVQLPQFKVRGHREKERVQELTTGNYSRLACEFYFVRSLGYYIIQIYVPSTLIVVLSWVSFWLSRDAVPARVALGITTVLTMTTLISSTNAALPKISYLKSIDVYLVTCFVMVFASLLEYAAVSYIGNRHKRRLRRGGYGACIDSAGEKLLGNGAVSCPSQHHCDVSEGLPTEVRLTNLRKLHTECDLRALTSTTTYITHSGGSSAHGAPSGSGYTSSGNGCGSTSGSQVRPPEGTRLANDADSNDEGQERICHLTCQDRVYCLRKPSIIDRYSRILFPASFMLFNFMYWVTYMNISNESIISDFIFIN